MQSTCLGTSKPTTVFRGRVRQQHLSGSGELEQADQGLRIEAIAARTAEQAGAPDQRDLEIAAADEPLAAPDREVGRTEVAVHRVDVVDVKRILLVPHVRL